MDIEKIDLNLLRVLDVLLREQHVSRAAQALHLSQPATSAALARLREALGDPLLVRGASGMQPTERAVDLAPKVRALLESVAQVLAPPGVFDAASAQMAFSISSSDYFIELANPSLAQRLLGKSPGLQLAWLPMQGEQLVSRMERGQIDLAITSAARAPEALRQRLLVNESFVGIARKRHPHLKSAPKLDAFCQLPHVLVSPSGRDLFHGTMDDVLAARGLARRVVFSVPQFRFAVDIVASTDAVAVFPARLAGLFSSRLMQFALPLQPPDFSVVMLWHERTHRSVPHQWLRSQLLDCLPPGQG
jgi:DNA-binding transcriptional LysR family regulator